MVALKVLIVDDEGIIGQDIEMRVAALGHQPLPFASSAHEARELLTRERPDVALLDINLGEGQEDGISLARELREKYDIPVIFVTAFATQEVIDRAKIVVPCGYIVKPVREPVLRSVLETALYKFESDQRFRRLARSLPVGVVVFEEIEGQLRLTQVNPFALQFDGKGEAEMLGMPLDGYLEMAEAASLRAPCRGVWETGASAVQTVTLLEGDQVRQWRSYYIYRHRDRELVLTFRDATEEKRVEVRLRRRTNELAAEKKETDILRRLITLVVNQSLSFEVKMQEAAFLLPDALDNPARGIGLIEAGNNAFPSRGYVASPWLVTRPLFSHGQQVGAVSLGYAGMAGTPFDGSLSRQESMRFDHVCDVLGCYLGMVDEIVYARKNRDVAFAALALVKEPLLLCNAEGVILRVNPAFEAISGCGGEEVGNLPLAVALPELEARWQLGSLVQGALKEGKEMENEEGVRAVPLWGNHSSVAVVGLILPRDLFGGGGGRHDG